VKRDLSEWLVWLRTHVRYDGWRFDFVKVRRVLQGVAHMLRGGL
jgi:hypothetical protein